jgi:excisionase family DNA binding protein
VTRENASSVSKRGPARTKLKDSAATDALEVNERNRAESEQSAAAVPCEAQRDQAIPIAPSSLADRHESQRGQPSQPRGPPTDDPSVRCYTVTEVAQILRAGVSTTYRNVVNGEIPGGIKIGGRWVVPHIAIVRLLSPREDAAA